MSHSDGMSVLTIVLHRGFGTNALGNAALSAASNHVAVSRDELWIGFLNHLFYGGRYSAGTGEVFIPLFVCEKTHVVSVGAAGERSGGAQKVLCGAVRLKSQRSPNPAGRNNSLAGSSSKRKEGMSASKVGLLYFSPCVVNKREQWDEES